MGSKWSLVFCILSRISSFYCWNIKQYFTCLEQVLLTHLKLFWTKYVRCSSSLSYYFFFYFFIFSSTTSVLISTKLVIMHPKVEEIHVLKKNSYWVFSLFIVYHPFPKIKIIIFFSYSWKIMLINILTINAANFERMYSSNVFLHDHHLHWMPPLKYQPFFLYNWSIECISFYMYVSLENISFIWKHHHCWWRAAKFRRS